MSRTPPRPWTVIVPVKSSTRAKSRIRLDPATRRVLAEAMARDTVSAVLSAEPVGRTVVVVERAADGAAFAVLPGVRVVVTSTRELNAAILDALARAIPDAAAPVAVVPADLPSLTAVELTEALAMAAEHQRSVVADHAGTGTTLLAAGAAAVLRPQYGEASFRRHTAAGFVPLTMPAGSGLRRDVDLLVDLPWVTGPATRSVLADLGRPQVRLTG